MTRNNWLPDTGRTLIPETAIGEADRLAEEAASRIDTCPPGPCTHVSRRKAERAALELLNPTPRVSPWVQRALAGQLPAKDLTPHRTPGFTAEDQLEGKRGKRKSLDAQRTQRAATQRRAIAIDTRR